MSTPMPFDDDYRLSQTEMMSIAGMARQMDQFRNEGFISVGQLTRFLGPGPKPNFILVRLNATPASARKLEAAQ